MNEGWEFSIEDGTVVNVPGQILGSGDEMAVTTNDGASLTVDPDDLFVRRIDA